MISFETKKRIARIGTTSTVILLLLFWYNRFTSGKFEYFQPVNDENISMYLVSPGSYEHQVSRLLDLKTIQWPPIELAPFPAGRRDVNGTVARLPAAFEPVMSRGQRALSKRLLKLFSDLMFEHNWGNRWILYGGTLIGSFRHHDFIPWDDDIDVLVDSELRPQVQQLLKSLRPEYRVLCQSKRDKFYTRLLNLSKQAGEVSDPELSRKSSRYSWGWPYLDIGYYLIKEGVVCELAISYGRRYCWPEYFVFPFIFRPLGELWLPTPYKLGSFLKKTYGSLDRCRMFGYSHVRENFGPFGNIPCVKIAGRYPFVQRAPTQKRCQLNGEQNTTLTLCSIVEEYLVKIRPGQENVIYHQLQLPQID